MASGKSVEAKRKIVSQPVAGAPIRVLLIEDNRGDARLVELLLGELGAGRFEVIWVDCLTDALTAINRRRIEAVLLDLSLPDSRGLEALEHLRAAHPCLPVIVLTGRNDDQMVLAALQKGAEDYLVKGQSDPDLVDRAIRYAIGRAEAAAQLRRSEERYRAVFENAGLGVGLVDRNGILFSRNPALRRMLAGLDRLKLLDYVHPEDGDRVELLLASLLGGQRDQLSLETRFLPETGAICWGRMHVSLVRDGEGQPQFAVCLIEDISSRKAMEEQLRLAARVLEATSEGIFVTDKDLRIVQINPAFTRLTGFEANEVVGRKPSALTSKRHGRDFFSELWGAIDRDGNWRGEIWDRKKDGEVVAYWLNLSAVKSDWGMTTHYFAVFSDITSRKLSEERLSHQANHDMLTDLPNRTLFQERLDRALAWAERNKLVFAVLFLDLDEFKEINDNLGHMAGDAVLREVSERLLATIRQNDTVARLGGDEFILLVEDINDFRDAATVCRKILSQISRPFEVGERTLSLSASIGVSLYPRDATDTAGLLHLADDAMYRAKRTGKANFRFAAQDLSEKSFEDGAMLNALRQAIDQDHLEVHYQPIVSLTDGHICAMEALLRCRHPDIGLMVPAQFLTLAAKGGFMPAILERVVRRAIRQLALWRQENPELRLSLNADRADLENGMLARIVSEAISDESLPADAIDIEVPPRLFDDTAGTCLGALADLRRFGCKVALDDLPPGPENLARLASLPVDVLKLSGDLARGLSSGNEAGQRALRAITFAHDHGMSVTAKALETDEQLDLLRDGRCDRAQGYLFSRPLPAEDAGALFGRLLGEKAGQAVS